MKKLLNKIAVGCSMVKTTINNIKQTINEEESKLIYLESEKKRKQKTEKRLKDAERLNNE